jgi:hypothetical protein
MTTTMTTSDRLYRRLMLTLLNLVPYANSGEKAQIIATMHLLNERKAGANV